MVILVKREFSTARAQHKPLLKLFSALAARISCYDDPPKDTGYWYGERALTGFLASAAWSLRDGWALEEFTGLRVNGKKQGSGRGDIWVGVNGHSYTIEAKAVWPGGSIDKAITGAETKLSDAATQLRCLHKMYQVGRPVALCYIIPDLNKKGRFAGSRTIRDFFTDMPKRFGDTRTAVASFWYEKQVPNYAGRIYPGVVIVARDGPRKTNEPRCKLELRYRFSHSNKL